MSETHAGAMNRYTVPALAHGLAVLDLFSRERPVLAPPEIARELSLARATVFRLLQTLEAAGYLAREDGGRAYRLGTKLLNRGFAFLASLDLVEVAQPILKRLRDDTGFSTHLVIRDGRDAVYVARFAARATMASGVTVGTRLPSHATLIGRMLLCDFTEDQLAALYPEAKLQSYSAQTPATRKQLAALLAGDRERGYATGQSFFERGVSTVAAPVRDNLRNIVAALNITAADSLVTLEEMNGRLKDLVLKASAEITEWIVAEGAARIRA